MASLPVKFSMVVACVLVLVMVVTAQNNGEDEFINNVSEMSNNMPGMLMGPSPAPTPESSTSPPIVSYSAAIAIFLPFMISFVVAK